MAEKMSLTIADAVDYKGFPADKSRTGGWVPAALSLGIEVIERLSTMGIAVNLVTYLGGTMHLSSATSANVVTDFMGFSNLQRIGIGLFLSAVGMAAAAISENKRLSVAKEFSENTTLPITVFLLIPQFFLVGAGEAFIYSGQLDFFITKSPKGMKTMSTGLFLATIALGFFLSSLLVSIVKNVTGSSIKQGWVGDNINSGRLDCFYGLLAALSFINFGLFLISAAWYRRKTVKNAPQLKITAKESEIEEKC
ncbi:Proton-dependent oligopeptide transporter family [Corchorus capsularis]|uniref:Proton-dependent oligopeptide transporter family n=1 Tax=Corchorus capsularis TaxID=210143 RepID=A0A1R3GUK6_COCAP|nr:Proton-dependent oligopeptide transporter family [Corchorus capsularis]